MKIIWGTFLASKINFPGRWWIQKPYKSQESHIYHRNLSSVAPHFFRQRKVPHWSSAVNAFLFPGGSEGPSVVSTFSSYRVRIADFENLTDRPGSSLRTPGRHPPSKAPRPRSTLDFKTPPRALPVGFPFPKDPAVLKTREIKVSTGRCALAGFADGGFAAWTVESGYGHCPGPLARMQICPSERTTGRRTNAYTLSSYAAAC